MTGGPIWVDVDKCYCPPAEWDRVRLDPRKVREYAEAMEMGHEFPPIEVCPAADGRWLVLDGHHRLNAATLRGQTRIRAVVFELPVGLPRLEHRVSRNVRSQLAYTEADLAHIARQFRALGCSLTYAARRCGVPAQKLEAIVARWDDPTAPLSVGEAMRRRRARHRHVPGAEEGGHPEPGGVAPEDERVARWLPVLREVREALLAGTLPEGLRPDIEALIKAWYAARSMRARRNWTSSGSASKAAGEEA